MKKDRGRHNNVSHSIEFSLQQVNRERTVTQSPSLFFVTYTTNNAFAATGATSLVKPPLFACCSYIRSLHPSLSTSQVRLVGKCARTPRFEPLTDRSPSQKKNCYVEAGKTLRRRRAHKTPVSPSFFCCGGGDE